MKIRKKITKFINTAWHRWEALPTAEAYQSDECIFAKVFESIMKYEGMSAEDLSDCFNNPPRHQGNFKAGLLENMRSVNEILNDDTR
jgi:hypothetical protein